jgi:hydroxymethylpyrimidine kinase/phosphomethylpyrimidine kinase
MKAGVALTISGVDPSGGAGITADAVTFSAVGVHGVAVATALTFQNTKGVAGYAAADVRDVQLQLDTLLDDVEVDAVKVGMLANDQLARALSPYLQRFKENEVPVVFDPVFRASGGEPLFKGVAKSAFTDFVLPFASLVTPNAAELAELVDEEPAKTVGELRTQVRIFHSRYGAPVLATGGHIKDGDEVVDIYFSAADMREFRRLRQHGEMHGTGCLVAAAVTAFLASHLNVVHAVERATDYVSASVAGAFAVGGGAAIPDRTAAVYYDAERWRVYSNLVRAVKVFEAATGSYKLIPEVGSNVGFALPNAAKVEDVCAVPGRLVRLGDRIKAVATPEFGASGHVARAILAAMARNHEIRAAINIRYGEDVIGACRELGMRVVQVSRADEPAESARAEGASVSWGVGRAIEEAGGVPDVIYDAGGPGKEPMVRVFGRDAVDVVRRVVAVSRRLA